MKCPHCGVGIRFEAQDDFPLIYPYDSPEKEGLGLELVHGFCSECAEIIVIFREGTYAKGSQGEELIDLTNEQIIYPKVIMSKPLEPEIPEDYRNDYQEAFAVLSISTKASAAISRRLLQHILREEYKIRSLSRTAIEK